MEGGGYYHVHGISEDESAEAADDDHEEDLWYVLMQACTEEDYNYIEKLCLEYCDLWEKFWDTQLENSEPMKENLSLIDERWIFSTERKCILKHLKFRDKINLKFEFL